VFLYPLFLIFSQTHFQTGTDFHLWSKATVSSNNRRRVRYSGEIHTPSGSLFSVLFRISEDPFNAATALPAHDVRVCFNREGKYDRAGRESLEVGERFVWKVRIQPYIFSSAFGRDASRSYFFNLRG
jgi:hypothetical protein